MSVPTLRHVVPAALASLGMSTGDHPLHFNKVHHNIVLLVDGLGEFQLISHAEYAPIFSEGSPGSVYTEFPSTTPVALASLGTGLSPSIHGFVGATFWLVPEDELFSPLKWGSDPHPLAMYPDRTLFEMAIEKGIDVATIAPIKHSNSGITRSVLRGPRYLSGGSITEILGQFQERLASLRTSTIPALTYVYWPELDRLGHAYGAGSTPWIEGLMEVNTLIDGLVSELAPGEQLIVTSDHGMVTCPVDKRISIENNAGLTHGVHHIGGEPRMRYLYTEPGSEVDVISAWNSILGERVHLLTRDQAIDEEYFCRSEPEFLQRIGDVLAIAADDSMFTSKLDPLTSSLLGQHGALTPAEMLVPLRVFTSDRHGNSEHGIM